MKPTLKQEDSGLKKTLARIGVLTGAFLLLTVPIFPQDYPPGILYVTFHPGAIDSLYQDSTGFILCGIPYLDSVNRANDCQGFRFIGHTALPLIANDYHVIFPNAANIPALAATYEVAVEVRWARPDYYVELFFTPNDPYFTQQEEGGPECYQWNMDAGHCQFEKAWDITKGDTGVVIAVIDNGCFYSHPDLQDNLWVNTPEDINNSGTFEPLPDSLGGDLDGDDDDGNGIIDDVIGYNFPFGGPPDPYIQINGHGTFTSSIAAAVTNDSLGVSGAGFNCRLMVISMYLQSHVTSVAVGALAYATKMGADVISMSWGAISDSSLILAIDSAYARNIALVGAFPNGGSLSINPYPASFAKVIGVAGVQHNDHRHPESSYGDSVDVSAPIKAWGALYRDTTTLQPIWDYTYVDPDGDTIPCLVSQEPPATCDCPEWDTLPPWGVGNSFAAPLVAGAAALVKSAYPNMTNAQIMAKLRTSTDPVNYSGQDSSDGIAGKMGTGRLNVLKR